MPSAYQNKTFIKTSNDDKDGSPNNSLTFTVNKAVSVYVAHDDRIEVIDKPSWLTDNFTDTGDDLSDDSPDNVTLSLYREDYPAGTVNLYQNGGSGPSYKLM